MLSAANPLIAGALAGSLALLQAVLTFGMHDGSLERWAVFALLLLPGLAMAGGLALVHDAPTEETA